MKTLEGSCFRRFTSNAKQKTYRIPHFHENPVPRVKDDTRKKLGDTTLHLKEELCITGGRYWISLIKSCLLDKTHSAAHVSHINLFWFML